MCVNGSTYQLILCILINVFIYIYTQITYALYIYVAALVNLIICILMCIDIYTNNMCIYLYMCTSTQITYTYIWQHLST